MEIRNQAIRSCELLQRCLKIEVDYYPGEALEHNHFLRGTDLRASLLVQKIK